MKFSIITPSLGRESLVRCCESVDAQTYGEWEHIVSFDGMEARQHAQPVNIRRIYIMSTPTHAWGNRQRWTAWVWATGDWVIHLDDDNILAHPNALADIAECLTAAGDAGWALFPIMRHGSRFLLTPPGMCMTDTANMVIKREFARWPDTDCREADGMLAEKLKAEHPCVVFPDCQPIIVMEKSSDGK